MQFTTECLSLRSYSPFHTSTPSPDAAWCICNQPMSALTPSCHQNMPLCSCVKNSHQEVARWKILQLWSIQDQSLLFRFALVWKGHCISLSGRCSASCLSCNSGLTIILYISVPVLIARDKPIAANKHEVKLPVGEKVISPSSCPHLPANLDIFQHRNVKYFLSPFTPQ